MSTIKNINKIAQLCTEQDLLKLDAGAQLHKRHSSIIFKVMLVDGKTIVIETRQEKSLSKQYLNKKGLIDRTKDLFGKFLPDFKFNVGAFPYEPSPVDVVDAEWLNKKMLATGVRAKDIVHDTGNDKSSVSDWVNGRNEMSQPVKAMFYYYFLNRK